MCECNLDEMCLSAILQEPAALWASCLCGLVSSMKYGKFSATITSDHSFLLCSVFSVWHSNCTVCYILPQSKVCVSSKFVYENLIPFVVLRGGSGTDGRGPGVELSGEGLMPSWKQRSLPLPPRGTRRQALPFWTPAARATRNRCLCFKPCRPWCFVTDAQVS
jgi:hypothetical protein